MKKHVMLACALLASAFLIASPMADIGEGEDGTRFLDPYLKKELSEVSGQAVLDVGCGAGVWSIIAAQNGAAVCRVENKASLIEMAEAAITKAGVENQVTLCQGDVSQLPYESGMFDRALSVNLGCQLLATQHFYSEGEMKVTGLEAHLKELARVLKEGGRLMVTAPVSFDVLFTDGSHSDQEVCGFIQERLEMIAESEDSEVITNHLGELKEVLRATFVRRDNRLVLVTDEKQLNVGEPIWCKIPNGVVSTYYHSEESYLVAIKSAGLTCEEIKRPCFFGKVKYNQYRASLKEGEQGLGEAYMNHHPFTIYYVVKQA